MCSGSMAYRTQWSRTEEASLLPSSPEPNTISLRFNRIPPLDTTPRPTGRQRESMPLLNNTCGAIAIINTIIGVSYLPWRNSLITTPYPKPQALPYSLLCTGTIQRTGNRRTGSRSDQVQGHRHQPLQRSKSSQKAYRLSTPTYITR